MSDDINPRRHSRALVPLLEIVLVLVIVAVVIAVHLLSRPASVIVNQQQCVVVMVQAPGGAIAHPICPDPLQRSPHAVPHEVPEPATLLLMGAGLAGVACLTRRAT